MKIIHVVLSSGADYTDNWGYQENTLPEEQCRLGHEVIVLTSTISSLSKNECEQMEGQYYINGVRIIRINPSCSFLNNRICFFTNKLYDIFEKEIPDLIFIHGFLMPSLREIKRYKRNHSDVIVFFDAHNTYVNSIKKFPFLNKYILHKGMWRYIYQNNKDLFDGGYYTAPQVKTFIQDMYGVDDNNLSFLPMGVYIPEYTLKNRNKIKSDFRKKYGISSTSKLLVVGGRLREEKKIFEIVSAINLIKDCNFDLLIFGSFNSAEYENKVKEIAKKNVIFIGWQNNKSIQNIYLSADLALFTGTQSVIWRTAVGCGLPSICRYSDGAEELDMGGNCIFLDDDNPRVWANAIEEIITNDNRLASMKNIAETKGVEFFSEERIAKKIINDYYMCNIKKNGVLK